MLEEYLGPRWEVLNLGVPGYSTVENLIQTALWLSDLNPDIALYYVGWNDVRNSHIKGLKSDYSDFHGQSQFHNLNLFAPSGKHSAGLYYAEKVVNHIFVGKSYRLTHIEGSSQKFTPTVDERALNLFIRNLRFIILLDRSLGIKPILIPQLLNYFV